LEITYVKKNLFNFRLSNSSNESGSLEGQITCGPCSSECKKMNSKINNRKLSDINNEEVLDILTPFKY
tara:strand:- start:434 stop:637 length:204 start_codon:yes stop_codon:yes gene_type:complete